ncbi:MAG: HDOD domain-containing protein [Proteobacteria bacterium]|nr:HDOD domain-containing protein [Pseudomonadota bacterium]MBU4054121.1 HDOD domain-containing protein [Pseudomonadota bacterium]
MPEKKQKILIVDDEELVLKSLKREFHDADFETVLADSGEKGLELLQNNDIDMVITDITMPGMSGLEFLKIVKDKHPDLTRIILSGFVEESLVIPAITQRVAHAYYTKPWTTKSFRNAVEQTLVLRKTLKDQALLALISRIDRLPTLPLVYQEFESAMAKDLPIKKIAGIVAEDVSIATRLLQVVNSAFYGQGTISSIDRAILALGLKFVKDIVFTVSLVRNMKWTQHQTRHLEQIFLHSSLVSFAVKAVYERAFGKKLDDRYASVGITHDIGRIILLQFFTERYEDTVNHQRANSYKDFQASEVELGYANMTHCEIGAYFLNWWNLPDANIRLALFHHAFKESNHPEKPEIQEIFYYANLWVNRLMEDQQTDPDDLSRFFNGFLKDGRMESIERELIEKIGQR